MSFMFNPFPHDDLTAVNRPKLPKEVAAAVVSGTKESAHYLSGVFKQFFAENPKRSCCLAAMDGYIGAQWEPTINMITQNLAEDGIDIVSVDISSRYKPSDELERAFAQYLPADRVKDPVLLFGRLLAGGFEELFDLHLIRELKETLLEKKTSAQGNKRLILVYGCGSAFEGLRSVYDYILFFDVTPKEAILRAKNGMMKNLGDEKPRSIKELLRRYYYIDFKVTSDLRGELLRQNVIDFYIASDDISRYHLIPKQTLAEIFSALVKYPFRCKPVYLEGVWGGQYFKRHRNLPESMRNCAWVFDLIPLEVSILIEVGEALIEVPFYTFVQKEGTALMGQRCVERFNGFFPVRLNYDDTYHGSGNMSIQVHPDEKYITENFNELGRQDEAYYVVATGHEAKTYLGFKEDADIDEFIRQVKRSETEYTSVDYEQFVNSIPSKPGAQFLIPAGTLHASGRNQIVLEVGSLTVGSYTYKLYDYLRADLDGIPRPIHTYHGEKVLNRDQRTNWVKQHLVQQPRLLRCGEGWAEYIVGEHDSIYFSLRRLEFMEKIEDDTDGVFHVLALVDGESVLIESLTDPSLNYRQDFLDVVIVPANFGRYVIKNLGNQPVYIHKTTLRNDF